MSTTDRRRGREVSLSLGFNWGKKGLILSLGRGEHYGSRERARDKFVIRVQLGEKKI